MTETTPPPHALFAGEQISDGLATTPARSDSLVATPATDPESVAAALERRGSEALVVGPGIPTTDWSALVDAARRVDDELPVVFLSDVAPPDLGARPAVEAVSPSDGDRLRRRLDALVADYRDRHESAAVAHLGSVGERIRDGEWSTADELFAAVCSAAVGFEGYEFAWYGRSSLQEGTLEPLAWSDSTGLNGTSFDPSDISAGWGPSGRAALTMDVSVVHDIGGNEDFLPWLDGSPGAYSVHAIAAVPVTLPGAGVPFGQLAVYAGRPHAFTGAERDALESLSRTLAERLAVLDRERWPVGEGAGRERLGELVAALPDLALVYDESGTYVDVLTPHQIRNFATPEDLVGEHATDVLPEEAATAVLDALDDAFASNEVRRTEYSIVVGDEPVWYEAKVAPVRLSDGRRVAVTTVRETTERKRTEHELSRQKNRIQRLTGILSHDLRNHLGKASGWADLAREAAAEDLEELDRVRLVLDEMEDLLDETIAMIRQSQRVLETESVDVGVVATECWTNLPERGELHVDPGLTPIEADADRVRQLLENLFVNVVEHAGSDSTVRVGPVENGFYVEDDGAGIPSDEWDSVFEFGYTSASDGSGFGLAIVEEIADAHGWSVSISESSQGGARFEFADVEWATAGASE